MNTPKQNEKRRASRVVTPKSEDVIDIASSDEDVVVLLPSPPKKRRQRQKAVIDLTERLKVKTEARSWKLKTENSVIDLTEEQSGSKNFNPNRQVSQDGIKSEKLDKPDGPFASIPDREVSSSTTPTSIKLDEMERPDGPVASIPDREVSSSTTPTSIKSEEMERPDGPLASIPDREVSSSTTPTSIKSEEMERPDGPIVSIPDREVSSSSSVPPAIIKSDDSSTTSDGPVSSNETVVEVLATVEQDSGPTPDGPVSSNETVAEVLATAEQDIRIKKEGDANVLPEEERERRQLCLEKWIQANRDPLTGMGRFVFRRGCAKHCITQILGGSGVDPFPIVKQPPENDFTGSPNQFIEANHFYAAGCESFNPFGPRFPGDKGLLNLAAFDTQVAQEEFHFFVECSGREHARHWHGPDAKGGRMYVGVYRKAYPDDEMITPVSYESIGPENMKEIAEFFWKRKRIPHATFSQYFDAARAYEGEDHWGQMKEKQQEVAACREYLLDTGYSMDNVPVEFVRYDEALYQALVSSDAAISRKGQTGMVSLEAETLGQYF